MNFKEHNTAYTSIVENKINMKEFINAVRSYSNIDDALGSLDPEYIEYYMININSKKLLKELQKIKLVETDAEKTLGYAPAEDKIIKTIKYRGQFITLEYDRDLGSWFPAIRFRSIISALKYIKKQVDYKEEDI